MPIYLDIEEEHTMEDAEAGLIDAHVNALAGNVADVKAALQSRDIAKLERALSIVERIARIALVVIGAMKGGK